MKPRHIAENTQKPLLATREEIARRYSVSVRTVDEWVAQKRIPVVRLSRRLIRFPIGECDDVIVGQHTIEPLAR